MEDAEWKPRRGPVPSKSTLLLRSMEPGTVKRICHPDVNCQWRQTGYACTLTTELARLRKKGWKVRAYHEAPHVLIVAREA